MKKVVIACFLTFVFNSFFGLSQTVLIEENFNSNLPSSWTMADQDGLLPAITSPVFNAAWIHYTNGADSCVASTSYYDPSGQSNDLLISPKISLGTFNKLVWKAKSVDASYPEDYVVLISTTDSLPSSFNDTLHYQLEESPYWGIHSILLDTMGYANQDIYICIKNISNDKFILLVDDFLVNTSEFAGLLNESIVFSIFPNPAEEFITINTPELKPITRIYDLEGRLIIQSTETMIDIRALSAGTYILDLLTKKGMVSQKFIKQ